MISIAVRNERLIGVLTLAQSKSFISSITGGNDGNNVLEVGGFEVDHPG